MYLIKIKVFLYSVITILFGFNIIFGDHFLSIFLLLGILIFSRLDLWKNESRKQRIFFSVALLLIGILIGILTQITTFEDVTSDMINEDEIVSKIKIENTHARVYGTSQYIEFETDDEKLIETILKEPSDMILKRQDRPPHWEYYITIYTDKSSYVIILGENDAHIGKSFYKILSENKLYHLIESETLDWKPFIK